MLLQIGKWGNSLALRIPSSVARAFALQEGRPVELTVEGDRLVIAPVDEQPHYNLDDLVAAITDENRYGEIDAGPAVGNEFA
jgi:antitoxin MazE